MKTITTILLTVMCFTVAAQKRIHNERYYQEAYYDTLKSNGYFPQMEVVLSDRTRCDILTCEYAIEVDFSSKWAESIGQSLHYAKMTGRKPMILLIVEDVLRDTKHVLIVMAMAELHDIRLVTIESDLTIVDFFKHDMKHN